MIDPVIGPDNHTYENETIQEWLKMNATSPLTKEEMKASQLRPNIAIRHAIETWTKEHADKHKSLSATIKGYLHRLQGRLSIFNDPSTGEPVHVLKQCVPLKLLQHQERDDALKQTAGAMDSIDTLIHRRRLGLDVRSQVGSSETVDQSGAVEAHEYF